MSNNTRYATYHSRHTHHARHAKPTRWARAVARVESVKLWLEVALTPVGVLA